jgi:hypothetical protein
MANAVDAIPNSVRVIMPFDISVDSSLVELFGVSAEDISGYVLDLGQVAGSLAGFYADGSNCLIEYQQASGDRNDLTAQTAHAAGANWAKKAIATALQSALHATLTDVSRLVNTGVTANSGEGTTIDMASQYTPHQSLGDFVVEWLAANVFGHPQATVAISNDNAIVALLHAQAAVVDVAAVSPLMTGAVAMRLIQALYQATEDKLQNVAEQVLEQDPTRFRSEDNKEDFEALKWQVGDVVYFKIQLAEYADFQMKRAPISNVAQAAPSLSSQVLGLSAPAATFYLKLTLA